MPSLRSVLCSANEGLERPGNCWHLGLVGDSRALNRVAASQAGAFSVRQARSAGFTSAAVNHRLRIGQWIRLDNSVYASAGAPDTWHQRLWAAVLSRDQAAITHEPALALLGLPGATSTSPVILAPRHGNTRSDIARVFESDQYDRIAKTSVVGIPVTTMPETLLVLARDAREAVVTKVFDQALITGLMDLRAMSRVIDREAGRRTPGTPLLRRLVSARRPTAPSKSSTYLERLLEQILGDERVPPWSREVEVVLDGEPARVDVYIASAQLVVEADGRNWHTRQESFDSDRRRDNSLAARGIQVLRFTYRMLESEPGKCLDQVIATCRVRAA